MICTYYFIRGVHLHILNNNKKKKIKYALKFSKICKSEFYICNSGNNVKSDQIIDFKIILNKILKMH